MNKNIIQSAVAIGLLCLSTAGNARNLDQGTVEIGGGLGLNIISIDVKQEGASKEDFDSTALSANALYYVAQNIGVGIAWDYSTSETRRGVYYKYEETSNSIGPMAAYNISLNEKTSLKLGGTLVKLTSESKETGYVTSTTDGYGWSLGGQLSYFLNDFVSLDGGLYYVSLSRENNKTKTSIDTTGFSTGIGLSVYLK